MGYFAVVTPIKSKMHEAEEKNKENNPVLLPETAEDLLAMLNTYVVYKPINLPLQVSIQKKDLDVQLRSRYVTKILSIFSMTAYIIVIELLALIKFLYLKMNILSCLNIYMI